MNIRIMTDSAADFSTEEAKAYHITRIPLQVVFGEDAYADGETLTPEIFWERLLAGENPKTSQPSPEAFLNAFEEAKAAGDAVVCITLSSGLSGTTQSALLAKSMIDYEPIYIVDSLTAATGEKLLVTIACRLRDEGKLTAQEIAAQIESLRGRLALYAGIDTLDYLARGGRIPKAAASLSSMIRFKVLITFGANGKLDLCGKGIGLHRAMDALIKLISADKIDTNYPVMPIYTYDPANCHNLLKKLNAQGVEFTAEEAMPVGATISTHIGPGAYGLTYIKAE